MDEDQIATQQLASAALNGNFIIREVFVAHLDAQLGGNAFQVLKER
jgi:hypothetical protein